MMLTDIKLLLGGKGGFRHNSGYMRHKSVHSTDAIHAAVLLCGNFHLESLGAFVDQVAACRLYSRDLHSPVDARSEPIFSVLDITLVSASPSAMSSAGYPFRADAGVGERRRFDVVFIPSMELSANEALGAVCEVSVLPWLRFQYEQGAVLVANGAAVFVLGEARLLVGMQVAVPWWLVEAFADRFPGTVVEQTAVMTEDRRILTAAPGLDHLVTARVVRNLVSDNMARWLIRRRSNFNLVDDHALGWAIRTEEQDTLVSRADAWLEQNYARPVKVADLSRHLRVSTRTLERHIKAAYGTSPVARLQAIRMEAACRILARKAFGVGRVSNLVGYGDVRFFREIFEREVGKSPEVFVACLGKGLS